MNDKLRTLVINAVKSALPLLVVAGVLDPSVDLAIIELAIVNFVGLAAYFYKDGQEQG